MSSTSPWETKRALRAFADGADEDAPEQVVEEAAETLDSVETAARFLACGGEDRLAEAIVRAVRADETATVRRGRRVLGSLRLLARALAGDPPSENVWTRSE